MFDKLKENYSVSSKNFLFFLLCWCGNEEYSNFTPPQVSANPTTPALQSCLRIELADCIKLQYCT